MDLLNHAAGLSKAIDCNKYCEPVCVSVILQLSFLGYSVYFNNLCFLLEVRFNVGVLRITSALMCNSDKATSLQSCYCFSTSASDLQVYSMFVNVLRILLKSLLYPSNNVLESLIQLNTYLLENTKIIDVFWFF